VSLTRGDGPTWAQVAGTMAATLLLVVVAVVVFDVAVPDRGVGVLEPVTVEFGALLLVAGLLTQFGDPWFLLLVATLVYLGGVDRSLVRDPRDGAFVLGVTFAAFSFVDLLKHLFAAPRPPGAGEVTVPGWFPAILDGAFRSITTGGGYAFPSGHALGTAAVFAALAYTLQVGSRRSRSVVAALGVLLVAGTRLLLGVHFLVDVAVGALAGVTLFAVAAGVWTREPKRVFALGAVLGVLAVVATAGAPESELWKAGQWLGASLGAGLAWHVIRPSTYLTQRQTAVVAILVCSLWLAIYVVSPPLVLTVLGTALAAGLTVAAPAVADRAT
jgi:membrane-associated phospholipid phosphatase